MTPEQIFLLVVVIVLIIVLIILIVSAWQWSQIYFNSIETAPISRTTAGWLFAANAFGAVIVLAALIYSAFVYTRTPKTTEIFSTQTTHHTETEMSPAVAPSFASSVPLTSPSPPSFTYSRPIPTGTSLYTIG